MILVAGSGTARRITGMYGTTVDLDGAVANTVAGGSVSYYAPVVARLCSPEQALCFGALATNNADVTEYLLPGYGLAATATEGGIIVTEAGIIQHFYVKCATGPVGDSIVFTVRKNGAPTAVVVTLTAGTTSGSDIANSTTVVPGDEITIEANPGGSISGGATAVKVSVGLTLT